MQYNRLIMIRTITGTIKDIEENTLTVDVRGVGYLIACPTLTNNFSLEQVLILHTYLAVRETALDLYGFPNKVELQMFELLLGVPKVGPKSALQIMTLATPTLLAEAAHKNDGVYLHKMSGIGKKTAENITDFLHKKIDRLPKSIPKTIAEESLDQVQTDAIDALVALGYDMNTARETIVRIAEEDSTVNSLVTAALKQIS
jgi:Holliday junction DNA helicase RuvA